MYLLPQLLATNQNHSIRCTVYSLQPSIPFLDRLLTDIYSNPFHIEIIKVSTRFEATCKYRQSFVPNFITNKAVEGDEMLSHNPLDNTKQWQYTQYLM